MDVAPGSYVAQGAPLVLRRDEFEPDDETVEDMRDAFSIGPRRTVGSDPLYAINQLVELAVRAMSPGINDPFTCATCVDRLAAALARVAARPWPDPRRWDDGHGGVWRATPRPDGGGASDLVDRAVNLIEGHSSSNGDGHADGEETDDNGTARRGRVRLLLCRPTFADLVTVSFAAIRHYAADDAAVLGRIMSGLTSIASRVPAERRGRLEPLREQAEAAMRCAEDLEAVDRGPVEREFERFRRVCSPETDTRDVHAHQPHGRAVPRI